MTSRPLSRAVSLALCCALLVLGASLFAGCASGSGACGACACEIFDPCECNPGDPRCCEPPDPCDPCAKPAE